MSPVDEEITAFVLIKEIHPVPEVRVAAGALVRRIKAHGPIEHHLDSSLELVSRDYGWDIAQEARFLVKDMKSRRRPERPRRDAARSLVRELGI